MSAIPLTALMHHPDWAAVRDLTQLGVSPMVTSSRIIRDVTTTVEIDGGALLVVMYSSLRNDWRLDTLLSRAVEQGASAVVIEGHRPLLSNTLALAHRFTLPILGAVAPLDAHQVFVRLSGDRSLERAALVLRALNHAAQAGPKVEDVLRQVTVALQRPVALIDRNGTPIAGEMNQEFIKLPMLLTADAHTTESSHRLPVNDHILLAHPIRLANAHAWLVALIPNGIDAETDAVESALTAVAPHIEQRLTQARMSLEQDAKRRTSLLGEVMQGQISAAIRRRALDLGWELAGWHTGVQIGVTQELDFSGRRDELMAGFAAEHLSPMVVESSDGWSSWTTSNQEPTAQEVQRIASAIRRVHNRLGATLDIHTGVGRPHPGPEGIARSLIEASDAARLAQGRPESGHFLHIDRLGLAQLLLAWTRTETFQPAARSLLEPLTAVPGDLIETLSAYLDAESSLTETAAVLGVHRNTVATRIHRIEKILHIDLSMPDDRLALHLACRTAHRLDRDRR